MCRSGPILLLAALFQAAVAQIPARPANNSMVLCSPDVGENYADGLFYLQRDQVVTLQADSSNTYRMSLNCTARFTADPSLTSNGTGYNLRIVYLNFYTDSSGGDKWTVLNDGAVVSSNYGDNRVPLPSAYTNRGAVLGLGFTSDATRAYSGVSVNISLVVVASPSPTASPATATTTPSIPPTPSQTASISKSASGTRTASATPVPSTAIVMCNSTAGSTKTQTVMMTAGVPLDIVTQPGNTTYPASALCQLTLVAPAGSGVRVIIRYTDVQAGADVLRIYDGATVAAPQLYQTTSSTFWGSEVAVDNSTTNTVLLSFTTDASLQYSGVRMVAEVAVQRPPTTSATPTATVSRSFSPAAPGSAIEFCPTSNGTDAAARAVKALNVTLGANSVPMSIEAFTNTGPTYALFISCSLTVFGPPGTLVQATITYMRTTAGDGTTALLDGPNASSPGIMSTSGIADYTYSPPQATFARSNAMTITFNADQGPPGGYGGARIVITAMAPTPSPSVTPSETPVPPSSLELCGRATNATRYAVRQLDARGGGSVNGSSLTILASALFNYPTNAVCGAYLLAAPGTRIAARIVNLHTAPAPAADPFVATSFDPVAGGAGALAPRQVVSAAGEYGYWFSTYWASAAQSSVVLPGLSPDISPGAASGGVLRLNFSSGSGYGPVYGAGLSCIPSPCMGYKSYLGFTVIVDALPLPAWQDTVCSPSARAASTVLSGGGGTVMGIVLPVGGSIDLTTTASQPYGSSLTCALTVFAPMLPGEVSRYAMWAAPGAAPAQPLNFTLRLRFEYAETEAPSGSAAGDRFRVFDGPSTVASPAVADIAGDATGTELGDIVASTGALHFSFSSDAVNNFRGAKVHIDVLPLTSAGMSSATRTASATPTASLSRGASASISATATVTRSSSGTATGSATGTLSGTMTGTPTRSNTGSISMSATASLSRGASPSNTATASGTASGTFAAIPSGLLVPSPSAGMQQATQSLTSSTTPTAPGAGGGVVVVAGSDRPSVSATATPSEPLVPLRVVIRVSQTLANMPFGFFSAGSTGATSPAATAWLRASVLAVRTALQPTIEGAGAKANITVMSVTDTATGSSVMLSGSVEVNAARRRRLLLQQRRAAAKADSNGLDAASSFGGDADTDADADARVSVAITRITRIYRNERMLQGSSCVITYGVAAELPMGSTSSGTPALTSLANTITSPAALASVSSAITTVLTPLESVLSLTPGSLSAPAAGASAAVVSYSTSGAAPSPGAGGGGGSSSDLPLGAVVGGAVGGLLVICVIVALVVLRRKQGSASAGSKHKAGKGKAGLGDGSSSSAGGSDEADLFVTNPYRGQAGLARPGADGGANLPAKARGGDRASLAPTSLGV